MSFVLENLPAALLLVEFGTHRLQLLLYVLECRIWRQRRERLAEISLDAAVVGALIQPSQHALAIRSHPYAYVKRRAFRSLLQRFRTTARSGRSPHQLLVENPFTPECARMVGNDAGNPKQSGSMFSALALPSSLRNQLLP